HELTAIDLATLKKVAVQAVPQSWFGLAADKSATRWWWSGGGEARLHLFAFDKGNLEPRESYPPRDKEGAAADPENTLSGFRTGVYFDATSGDLFSLTILPKGGNKSFAWG